MSLLGGVRALNPRKFQTDTLGKLPTRTIDDIQISG